MNANAGTAFAAIDLGAESGRVVVGRFDGECVGLEELRRFPNMPVRMLDGLHWNVLSLYQNVKDGIAEAHRSTGNALESTGVDSWAVDFGLLDSTGALLSNPYHYRDTRTEGTIERALERVAAEEIYSITGVQFMPINTLYQLLAMDGTPQLQAADTLLMIPDLLTYWLTGEKACERTNATTTQLYDVGSANWACNLMDRLGIPAHIFPAIVEPGTHRSPLLPEIVEELGVNRALQVVSIASHDTASAVVAVPAETPHYAYISSGTWSLVGMEVACPILTDAAREANFTNEGGFGGTTRFLKNVMGLWLLQECRRAWVQQGKEFSYERLTELAGLAPAWGPLMDPDDPAFLAPGDMPRRIAERCLQTGQQPPREPAEYVRCVLESLALKYRWVLERAEQLSGQRAEVVHVVGGGARNELLCRLTADATGRPVLAGPTEATALGNVMVQALAADRVGSLRQIRQVVRASTRLRSYEPRGAQGWDEAWERFKLLLAREDRFQKEGQDGEHG